MIRKVIILFSLCCVVLCAFVGYLSYDVTQESAKADAVAKPATCDEVLKTPLMQTTRVMLTGFAPGKHLASRDYDGDSQWESLCVPLFPRKHQKIGHGYCAVLVCFKNVPTREALDTLLESGELDVNFWPERQNLERAIHSQLAQKYKNMDLAKSPVLYYGFDVNNPVLGETSLLASAGIGSVALAIAFLAMISGLFLRKKPEVFDVNEEERPTTNRAGLPDGNAPSIFDQVTSARSVMSE